MIIKGWFIDQEIELDFITLQTQAYNNSEIIITKEKAELLEVLFRLKRVIDDSSDYSSD